MNVIPLNYFCIYTKIIERFKFIEIPTVSTIPYNSIPSSLPDDKWHRVDTSKDMERLFISRYQFHLSRAQIYSFIITPLTKLLGPYSFTDIGNALLLEDTDLGSLPISSLKKYVCINKHKT